MPILLLLLIDEYIWGKPHFEKCDIIMTRHGRNATNAAVYTYHERQKDARASGYGSEKCRLGKDSLKGYDCCSLTLQPCRTPLVSPEGWLFDKEALLKYIIEKKQECARKLKEYERQKDRDLKDLHEIAAAEKQSALEKFEKAEKNIIYNKYKKETKSVTESERAAAYSVTPVRGGGESSTSSTPLRADLTPSTPGTSTQSAAVDGGAGGVSTKGALPSFWIPMLTPQAEKSRVEKPDKTIYCPMSGKPIKFKDMIEVKFTLLDKSDAKNDGQKLIAKEERYKCAVTHDILNNATPVAVLRPTGDVVTVECVEKIIRKDMIHPLTGQTLKEKDIILLQRGGTGYSATNDQLKAVHYRPSSLLA